MNNYRMNNYCNNGRYGRSLRTSSPQSSGCMIEPLSDSASQSRRTGNNCDSVYDGGCRNSASNSNIYDKMHESCSCDEKKDTCNDCLDNKSLAMAYVPWQKWEKTLSAGEGLCNGTIFPSLVLPFYGCMLCGNTSKGGRR